ncbi:hypothetical protein B0H13DRAFT_2440618 [Mycena leptocephala]|nr:hypothetical protein B0H13DRAFT_2440618 [Mycena leptocephala]
MAEAIGPSNETQVLNYGVADLTSFTPICGIYENGVPVCVAIFSYVDNPSGANTVHAVISIARATMPASVRVKYLAVTTVVQKLEVYVGGADVRRQLRVRRTPLRHARHQERAMRYNGATKFNR